MHAVNPQHRRQRVGRAPAEDIRPIAAAFLKGEAVEGEVAVITREQAAEADYNLSPSRWVGQAAGGDEVDLQDIMERFEAIVAEEATVSANLQTVLTRLRSLA